MPSLALCNAICRHSLSSLEISWARLLASAASLASSRPRTRERDWARSSAISGTAQTPPFDYEDENEFEDDYELLWRLSAVLSDEDDSQDLEWTGSSRKE